MPTTGVVAVQAVARPDDSVCACRVRRSVVTTSPRDLWQAQREVWWSQLLSTWTIRRLSPWRSLTQPVYQLEGLGLRERRKRVALIRSGKAGAAALMTSAFSYAELVLTLALLSLVFWFAPERAEPDLADCFLA